MATATKGTAVPMHTTGPYRANNAWQLAHAAAKGAAAGNPQYAAGVQVLTHLAWRAPGGAVGWHKGTNPTMVANATAMGVATGMPVQAAMVAVLAHMAASNPTAPQAAALATLAQLVG